MHDSSLRELHHVLTAMVGSSRRRGRRFRYVLIGVSSISCVAVSVVETSPGWAERHSLQAFVMADAVPHFQILIN